VTPPTPEPPKPQEPALKLSDAHKEVIIRFAAKFPLAVTEDGSREWTHKLAQQMKFSFPAEKWGHKAASDTRPHSADAIAIPSPFIGWDVISGAGAPGATLQLDSDSIDLTGQAFEAVEAIDHIGVPPVTPPPVTPPPTGDFGPVLLEMLVELKKQTALLAAMAQGLQALPAQLDGTLVKLNETISKGIKIRF
jgi:hypothetical protein